MKKRRSRRKKWTIPRNIGLPKVVHKTVRIQLRKTISRVVPPQMKNLRYRKQFGRGHFEYGTTRDGIPNAKLVGYPTKTTRVRFVANPLNGLTASGEQKIGRLKVTGEHELLSRESGIHIEKLRRRRRKRRIRKY